MSRNLGALTLLDPSGPAWPVMGVLYLYLYFFTYGYADMLVQMNYRITAVGTPSRLHTESPKWFFLSPEKLYFSSCDSVLGMGYVSVADTGTYFSCISW
jgi:hypothetical protein